MTERFDGESFNIGRDGFRLTSQLERVRELMEDGQWRTLDQIVEVTGGTVASVSARLRDFRKQRFGGHTVSRRYLYSGLWEYKMGEDDASAN